MKYSKAFALALAVCLLLSACSPSASPSRLPPSVAPSPSPSPSPSLTPTPSPALQGDGVSVFYSEAWGGNLASLVLMGRLVDGVWEDWILGASTEQGRPITLTEAAGISKDLPVLCETPQVALNDTLHLYTPDGYAQDSVVAGLYFRHWSNSGISSIYLSTQDLVFPSELPVLGFSDKNPDRQIIPMEFEDGKGSIEADFDGDGAKETVEFEYIESAQVVKRFFVKDGVRTELERLGCRDFDATMYVCAVNLDGGERYWLFERNTDITFGYFGLSGWSDGSFDFLFKMDM